MTDIDVFTLAAARLADARGITRAAAAEILARDPTSLAEMKIEFEAMTPEQLVAEHRIDSPSSGDRMKTTVILTVGESAEVAGVTITALHGGMHQEGNNPPAPRLTIKVDDGKAEAEPEAEPKADPEKPVDPPATDDSASGHA